MRAAPKNVQNSTFILLKVMQSNVLDKMDSGADPQPEQHCLLNRRAATFFHSSVADRCPVCKASACPDVRKQIMVKGGSFRGRH
ncbi:hypothetical protein T06_9636 [Trichinella sp. T6]|nr:hypothetical protein T06_9636 [Trichinella sp. T6]